MSASHPTPRAMRHTVLVHWNDGTVTTATRPANQVLAYVRRMRDVAAVVRVEVEGAEDFRVIQAILREAAAKVREQVPAQRVARAVAAERLAASLRRIAMGRAVHWAWRPGYQLDREGAR